MMNFNLEQHIDRQIRWSRNTFGPGQRTNGVISHIRKELNEIEANPTDVEEWIDVIILAIDGAWRAGYTSGQIVEALVAKQVKNEARQWPDWTSFSQDEAIEHVKGEKENESRIAELEEENVVLRRKVDEMTRIVGNKR